MGQQGLFFHSSSGVIKCQAIRRFIKGSSPANLKVVSATFLLVCFVSLKERNCETRKNVFYFTSKALFVLEIIKL